MVERKGSTAADPIHFLRRATEIQVDVIDTEFIDGVSHSCVHDAWVDAIKLQAYAPVRRHRTAPSLSVAGLRSMSARADTISLTYSAAP